MIEMETKQQKDTNNILVHLPSRDEPSFQAALENELDINDAVDAFVSEYQKPEKKKQKKTGNKLDAAIVAKLQEDSMLVCPSGTREFEFDLTPENKDADYTFEGLFGIQAADPFESDIDYSVIPAPDYTKRSIVTRQVQAYYEGQKKMRVPTLPVDPQCYEIKSADRLVYEERNNLYWESVLNQLGLDNEDHIKFIMKPDFSDVLPQMLNKFKHGLMPTIDSTWTIAPRLNPCTVFERLSKNVSFAPFFPSYEFDKINGVLIFDHKDFAAPLRYKTNNDADLEHNAFRRVLVLVNRKLDGSLDNIIRNLKHYGTSMVQSRNIPRYLGTDDKFLEYNDQLTKYCADIRQNDMTKEGDKLYKAILRAKQFRYSFEERNKENLYYSENPRSSYFRYEFFLPDENVNRIAIFAPDKRVTHSSLMPLLSNGKYDIWFFSDIAVNEHGNAPRIYQRVINVRPTNDFYRMECSALNEIDIIYLDFVEVKVLGRMLFGSYCQTNILSRSIQEKGYSGKLVARLGISPEYPLIKGYCISAISIFKAGGLEYVAQIHKAEAEEWNTSMFAKLYALKYYVEYARRVTLMAGFGLMCHDYYRPVKNEIRWTVPETAFALTGGTFKPFAYQHTRQTNKFMVRSEDFLDNWVSLSKEGQNPEDRLYSSALLHSNFDIDAAIGLLDSMQVPNSEARLKSVMNQMVKMNELPKDLLGAIRVSITLPKRKSYLMKRCKRLDDYIGLFEVMDDDPDPMMRFAGACEMTDQMRTVYDINNMRVREGAGNMFLAM
jgi:hypothetical protein